MSAWPYVQIRHIARFAYGDSLAAEDRCDGAIQVFGSNGPVGIHDTANTASPVLVIGRKGSYGKIQYSARPVFAIDTTYFVDPSTTRHNLRWLYYALLTIGLDGLSQDVGVPGLSREVAYRERLRLPSSAEQRAIADYLDTETARIDDVIAKKQRIVELLIERLNEARANEFQSRPGWPLKRLLATPMAYGVLVPRFVEPGAGTPMLRITDLDTRGAVRLEGVAWIEAALSLEFRRTIVASGDLVLSVVGTMGRAAVVPPEVGGSNVNRALARLQPRCGVSPRLLWHWTQTRSFLDQARLATGSGAAQPTLNLGDLARFNVGLPADVDEWQGILHRLDSVADRTNRAVDAVAAQIELLAERRQALITAAVTGEVDVPGVAA